MKSSKLLRRIRVRLHQRFGVLSFRRSAPDVAEWLQTPLGAAFLAEQRECLERHLQDLFGYHLVQMSIDPGLDLTPGSRISHKINVAPLLKGKHLEAEATLSPLISSYQSLPLPSESVDLVILHHLLDYSQSPHQLLREVSRVLIPRGHLVIVGFNPWSGFGLMRQVARLLTRRPLWRHQALRRGRLIDWLQLVDLQPVAVERGFYRPPFRHRGMLERLHWIERWGKKLQCPGGGFYTIVACKEVAAAIPMKPAWEERPKPAPGLGVNPLRRDRND